ncbi:TPA: transposase domain-containing protein, partial [Escherichia coli]
LCRHPPHSQQAIIGCQFPYREAADIQKTHDRIFKTCDHGGERGALLYGLIGTCRLNGIDPEAYLRHILSVLPEWPSNRVDELLPWNVVLTNK